MEKKKRGRQDEVEWWETEMGKSTAADVNVENNQGAKNNQGAGRAKTGVKIYIGRIWEIDTKFPVSVVWGEGGDVVDVDVAHLNYNKNPTTATTTKDDSNHHDDNDDKINHNNNNKKSSAASNQQQQQQSSSKISVRSKKTFSSNTDLDPNLSDVGNNETTATTTPTTGPGAQALVLNMKLKDSLDGSFVVFTKTHLEVVLHQNWRPVYLSC